MSILTFDKSQQVTVAGKLVTHIADVVNVAQNDKGRENRYEF